MTGIFNNAFGGGLRSGSAIADLVRQGRQESALQRLAQDFSANKDYGALGQGLVSLGMPMQGIRAAEIPYRREQDALSRQHQDRVFGANQTHRNRLFEAQERHRAAQLGNQAQQIAIARQRLGVAQQPDLPAGYMWKDPSDRSAGVSVLPGYTPTQGQESWGAPVRTVDKQGNPTLVQFSNRGNQRPVDGYAPSTALQKTDTGNEQVYTNAFTGQVVARVPKDNYQPAFDKAAGAAAGKEQGEFAIKSSGDIEAAGRVSGLVTDALNHPGLSGAVGPIDSRKPDVVLGKDALAFRRRVEQLQGNAFLQAYQSLKGGGPITDIEGEKATAAQARLNTSNSEKEYKAALLEMQQLVDERKRKIEARRQEIGLDAEINDLINRYAD